MTEKKTDKAASEPKDQRIPIMMSASEVAAVDDWMFKNRVRSRAEAIRRLCHAAVLSEDWLADIASEHRALMDAYVVATRHTTESIRGKESTPEETREKMQPLLRAILRSMFLISQAQNQSGAARQEPLDDIPEAINRLRQEFKSTDEVFGAGTNEFHGMLEKLIGKIERDGE